MSPYYEQSRGRGRLHRVIGFSSHVLRLTVPPRANQSVESMLFVRLSDHRFTRT